MDSFVEGIPEGLSVIKRTNKGACLESLECDSQALTDLSLSLGLESCFARHGRWIRLLAILFCFSRVFHWDIIFFLGKR